MTYSFRDAPFCSVCMRYQLYRQVSHVSRYQQNWRGTLSPALYGYVATPSCPFIAVLLPLPLQNISRIHQLEYLDTIDMGVEVSRQGLESGQYRWTITFLDQGDDFELEDMVSRNFLNDSSGATPKVTATKVNKAQ